MARKTIVIVGGALSGPTAAARAREQDEDARIVLLERSRDVSYAVGGLSSALAGEVASVDDLNRERAEFFHDVYQVEVRTKTAVSGIDADKHRIQLGAKGMKYDALIYAAGAESIVPDITQLRGAGNVVCFRTLLDLEAIQGAIDKGARKVTVIGGGYFGVEAADGLARRGVKVTLVEHGPRLLPQYTAEIAGRAHKALRALGVSIVTGQEFVRAYRKGKDVSSLALRGKKTLHPDLVVVAAGMTPRTKLLADAGAKLLPDGTVKINSHCATSLPDVYACGTCVSVPHAVTGKPQWLPQAAQADKTAQVAGACAAGGKGTVGKALGTAVLRAGDLTIARTGLGESAAREFAGKGFRAVRVHTPSVDPFMPGSRSVTVVAFFDRRAGRVLGAEVAAEAGADKRIDVLAAAIAGQLTIDQLASLELGYSPSVSAARDPVNVAGTVGTAIRRGLAKAWAPEEVAAERKELTVVDVRSAKAFEEGTIRGAMSIPIGKLRDQSKALRPDRPVVFVSDSGREGYLAARIAAANGLLQVGYLSGGLESWSAEGRRLAGGTA